MTQVDRSQETRKEVRPGLTDNYTPAANILIRGFSELSISERYVAIGLVSLYWDEKVYPVSLRELAARIQIDHTALRSRGGKRPAEGILDKLWRLGIIGLMEGKPLTETGNKGRVQTYIVVNHSFIAECNRTCQTPKGSKTPRYTVGSTNSKNRSTHTVGTDNNNVGKNNHTVGTTNDTVENTNHTVVHSSVESPPKNSKNLSNTFLKDERKRDECANAPYTLPFTQEEIALIVRSRIPEGDAILLERFANGSHRIYRRSGLSIGELIPVGVDVSEGLLALITVDSTVDALPEMSYSQEIPQHTPLEQNTNTMGVVPDAGYKTNTPSQQRKLAKGKGRGNKNEKTEQPSLPFDGGLALNEDEQRISDWFCQFWFIRVPPKVNELYKKHCKTLVPHVHSWEEMQSLEKAARSYLQSQLKPGTKVGALHLGNFTNPNVLNGWHPNTPGEFVAKSGEHSKPAMVYQIDEERNKRNQDKKAQAIADEFQARMARGGKFDLFELEYMVEEGLPMSPELMSQYNQLRSLAVAR